MRFSRHLSCIPLDSLLLLILHTAILPGNYRLEAPISPQHLAFVGCFFLRGSSLFSYHLLLDEKRECNGIHQVQSKSKPFAVGEATRFLTGPDLTILNNIQLSEVMSGATYLHDLGIIHRDLKGVLSLIYDVFFNYC